MTSNAENLKNSKFVKTILMLLVILVHACSFWNGYWFNVVPVLIPSEGAVIISSWLKSFLMYAFVLVAGYIFAYKTMNGDYNDFWPFVCNKFKRLIIPYVFVMAVWVAPIARILFKYDFKTMIKRYILCISPNQLWFLWMLFDVFIIVWPIRKILLEKRILGWVIALVSFLVGKVGYNITPDYFNIWTATQYLPFFFIGMRIYAKEQKKELLLSEKIPWFIWLIINVALFALMQFKHFDGKVGDVIELGLTVSMYISGAIMAWAGLQKIARIIPWKNSKAFKILSSYTMPLYLFHQQIVYFVILLLNGKVSPWLNVAANFIIAIGGAFIISVILMKFKVTRFLLGEGSK